ncbi:MAG: radical SAM protein [Candidatus Pacebacteria bacterium]|nr:radical SAM protein [Candidatus Paceibacterota bacterium]
MDLRPIVLPDNSTYIAAFLTFNCQLRCPYCINFHGDDLIKNRRLSGKDWIKGLNRLVTRPNLPITLQGGEPTVHKNFYEIVDGVKTESRLELLTNLEIDITKFRSLVPAHRFMRGDGYPAIRVSYHHGQSDFENLVDKVLHLSRRGYSIAIWEVGHPDFIVDVAKRKHLAKQLGVDYRIKEFLGPWKGKNYGTMGYPDAVNSGRLRSCECRTSELLIAPDGNIFRCHSDLYSGRGPIGNILDPEPPELGQWRHCSVFGKCNSCDIRVQAKPYKAVGHTSVEIKNISTPQGITTPNNTVRNTYGKTS